MSNHSVASNSRSLSAHVTGVPSGYQQSDCGIIPIDWECRSVASMGSVVAGKALAVSGPGTQRPYLRTKNVFDGRIDLSDVLTMPMTDSQFAVYELHAGDVLLNEGQSLELVGRCSIYHGEYGEPCAIQNQLIRFRARQDVSAEYATHLFRHCQKTGAFAQIALQTTSIAHLGVGRFERLLLPWPSKYDEQRAIAAALSDMDELIGALDKLIAKKRAIKLATMQQLLTGKTRLPGCQKSNGFKSTEVGLVPEDWDVVQIESVISDISMGPFGSDITVSNFVSEGVPVLSGANIGTDCLVDVFQNYVSKAKAKSLKKAVATRGDIVVTHRGTLGQIAYIPEDSQFEEYVISQSQFRVRFAEQFCIPCWPVLYLRSHKGAVALLGGKGHSGVPAIAQATTTFRNLHMPLPKLEEQRVIANVLADMDVEIAALEQRRDKTKAIKQGMMQSLLTGRIRLVHVEAVKPEVVMALDCQKDEGNA